MPLLFTENDSSSYLSTKEASELSGYNPDYLSRLCREGVLKGKQFGRAWIIDRVALEEFTATQRGRKEQLRANLAEERVRDYQELQGPAPVRSPFVWKSTEDVDRSVTYNRPLAALAVALVVVAGSAYASVSPVVGDTLARAPQAAEGIARVFAPQVVLPESDFRITQTGSSDSVASIALVIPAPQTVSANVARATDFNTASVAMVARPSEDLTVTGEMRVAALVSAVTHPYETMRSVAAAGIRAYVASGWHVLDAMYAARDAYYGTVLAAGEGSLDAALVARDASTRVPDAALASYQRGIESYAAAAPQAADAAVYATYATGSLLADAGLAAPQTIARAVDTTAQQAGDAALAVLDRATGTEIAIAPYEEPPQEDSIQATVLGFMGNAVSRIDGNDVAATPQMAGVGAAPGSWQRGMLSMLSGAFDYALSAVYDGARILASVFGLPSATPDLALLPFTDGESAALPTPADIIVIGGSYGIGLPVLDSTVAQTIINQYYPQTIVTGPTDEYILALVRPLVSRTSEGSSDRSRTKAEKRNGELENPTIDGGTARLEYAEIKNLIASSTTIGEVTFGVATITSATSTNLFSEQAIFTNASSTNLYALAATLIDAVVTNLRTENATTTNATTTNSFITSLRATTGIVDTLTSTLANIATAVITDLTATNAVLTNATTTNATTTNAYVENAFTVNATTTNSFISSLRAATGIIDTLTATLATITDAFVTNLAVTNSTTTNATTTNAYTENAVTLNATTTNAFISSLRTTTGIIDTLTSTLATLTDAVITNLAATNATLTNAVLTNATTTNAYIQSLTVGTSSATGLTVSGNTVLGGSSADSIIVNASFNSNLVPSTNATFDLGSPSYFWDDGYFDTITVNNISAASTSIAGTASETFTINSDNTTADTEDASLLFYRGMVVPNALLTWNSTRDRFEFNQPLYIENMSGSTTIPTFMTKGIVGQSASIMQVLDSSSSTIFAVNPNGRVGIGTSSSAAAGQLTIDMSNALNERSIYIPGATTTRSYIFMERYGLPGSGLVIGQQARALSANGTQNASVIRSAGGLDENLVLQPGINASTGARGDLTLNFDGGRTFIGTATSSALLSIGSTSPSINLLSINGAGTDSLVFTNAGRLGINTASPSFNLQVDSTVGAGNLAGGVIAVGGFAAKSSSLTGFSGAVLATGVLSLGSGSALPDVTIQRQTGGNVSITSTGTGNVGIGTTTPSAKLSVTSSGTSTGRAFAIADSANAERFTVLDNGNVGIGSSAPSTALFIEGSQPILTLNTTLSNNSSRINFRSGNFLSSALVADNDQGTFTIVHGGGNRFLIDGSGNIGLSTSTPNTRLTIAASASNGLNLDTDVSDGTASARIFFSTATAGQAAALYNSAGSLLFNTGATVGSSSGTERMRLTAAGFLGIGTSTPTARLSIVSSASSTLASTFDGSAFTALDGSNTGSVLGYRPSDASVFNAFKANQLLLYAGNAATNGIALLTEGAPIIFGVNGNHAISYNLNDLNTVGGAGDSLNLATNSNLIATNIVGGGLNPNGGGSTYGALTIQGGAGSGANSAGSVLTLAGGQSTGSASGGALVFQTSAAGAAGSTLNGLAERMRITSTGNVGIGTTSPFQLLSVGGAAQIDGNLTVGTVSGVSRALTIVSNNQDASLQLIADNNNAGSEGDNAWIFLSQDGAAVTGLIGFSGDAGDAPDETLYSGTLQNALLMGSKGNTPLQLGTNAAVRLTVAAAGNVGIGTTSPYAKLSVVGQTVGEYFTATSTSAINTFPNLLTTSATTTNLGLGGSTFTSLLGNGLTNASGALTISTTSLSSGFFLQNGNSFGTTAVLGTNDAQNLAFETGGSTRLTINTSGNVGIGTTSPSYPLHVYSTGVFAAGFSSNSSSAGLSLESTNTGGRTYEIYSTADASSLGGGRFSIRDATAGAHRFTIDSSGNIGIGSTTPSATLSVTGNARFLASGRIITLDGDRLNWETISNLSIGSQSTGSGNIIFDYPTSGSLQIRRAGGSAFAAFDSSSNFGLGTTTPLAKLHVSGGNILLDNNQVLQFRDTTGTARQALTLNSSNVLVLGGAGNISLDLYANNVQAARIDSSGNLGVGTTSPSARLAVTSAGTGTGRAFVIADSSNTERFTLLDNGRIGTGGYTSPANDLQVGGAGKVGIGTVYTYAALNFQSSSAANLISSSRTDGTQTGYIATNGWNGFHTSSGFGVGGAVPLASANFYVANSSGFGTSTPIYKVHVQGTTAAPTALFASSGTDTGLFVNNVSDNDVFLGNNVAWNGSAGVAKATSASLIEFESGNIHLTANTGLTAGNTYTGTKRLTIIGSTGSVGIGTSTPLSNYTLSIDSGSNNPLYLNRSGGDPGISLAENYTIVGQLRADTGLSNIGLANSGGSFLLAANTGTGFVGIGTTSPGYLLDLYGNGATLSFTNTASSNKQWRFRTNSNNLEFVETNVGVSMTLQAGGNVGIGTTSPRGLLEVSSGGATDMYVKAGTGASLRVEAGSTANIADIGIFQAAAGGYRAYGNYFLTTATDSDLQIISRANNVDSTRITVKNATGNVGVGTTSPAALFSVGGNGYFSGNLGVGVSSASAPLHVQSSGTTQALFESIGANRAAIRLNNSTAGQQALVEFLDASTLKFQFGKDASNNFIAYDALNTRNFLTETTAGNLVLQPVAGNVGVGTSTPSALFSVAGNGYFSGSVGIGIASPAQLLHVRGSGARIRIDSTSGDPVLEMAGTSFTNYLFTRQTNGAWYLRTDSASRHVMLQVGDAAGTQGYVQVGNGSDATATGPTPTSQLSIRANLNSSTFGILDAQNYAGTSQFFVRSDGRVGIGTTSPSTIGSVNANLTITNSTDSVSATSTLDIKSLGYAGINVIGDYDNSTGEPGGAYLRFFLDGNLTNGGIIGMNNATAVDPSGRSFTDMLSNSFIFGSKNSTSALQFGANNAVGMTIDLSNNVGIGTTSPVAKLSVAGFINTDEFNGYQQGGRLLAYASSTTGGTVFGIGAGGTAATTSSVTGTGNTAIGYEALRSLVSNGANTAVGYNALRAATSSSSNTALGYEALLNTGGNNNVGVGVSALRANTFGYSNVGVGVSALRVNTTGYRNIAIGDGAMDLSTTGFENTAIGFNAFGRSTGANNAVIVGKSAGFFNTTGSLSTLIGAEAGQGSGNYTSVGSVALGYRAGYVFGTGSDYNIAIGYQAGDNITTGARNIVIGYDINAPSATGNDQLNIGNTIYGNLSTGTVGIGSTTPSAKLAISHDTASYPALRISNGFNSNVIDLEYTGVSGSSVSITDSGFAPSINISKTTGAATSNANSAGLVVSGTYSHNGTVPASGTMGRGIQLTVSNNTGTAGSLIGADISATANSSGATAVGLNVAAASSAGTAYAALFNGGNVGIGTTTPRSRLSVSATNNADGIRIDATAASTNPGISFYSSEGTLRAYGAALVTSANAYFTGAAANDLAIRADTTGSKIHLGVGGAAPLLTVANASAGIGTTTASARLAITAVGGATGRAIALANSSNVDVFTVLDNGTGYFAGNLGVGVVATNKFDVQGNSSLLGNTSILTSVDSAVYLNVGVNGGSALSSANPVYGIKTIPTQTGTGAVIGIRAQALLSSAGTTADITGIQAAIRAASASSVNGYGIDIQAPTINGTSTITNLYGLYVGQQNATGVTNPYGIYQSATGDRNYFAGNVGLGTTTPSARFALTGSGTGTGRALAIANSSNIETVTVLDNGTVGIGTTSPSFSSKLAISGTSLSHGATAPLYVLSSTKYDLGQGSSLGVSALLEGVSGAATPGLGFKFASTGGLVGLSTSGALEFYASSTAPALSSTDLKMTILGSNGNVGIGATNPGSKLTVTVTSTQDGINVTSAGAIQPGIRVSDTTNSRAGLMRLAGGSSGILQLGGGSAGTSLDSLNLGTDVIGSSANSYLDISTTRFNFLNGNLGISTSTPAQRLAVQGNALISGDITSVAAITATSTITGSTFTGTGTGTSTLAGNLRVGNGSLPSYSASALLVNPNSSVSTIDLYDQGGRRLLITTSRNTLDSYITTDATLGYFDSGSMLLRTNQAVAGTHIYLQPGSTGNVGVATGTPTARLAVTGSGATTGRAFTVANSSNVDKFTVLDNGTVQVTNQVTNNGGDLTLNGQGNVDIASFGGVSFRVRNTGTSVIAGGLSITSSIGGSGGVATVFGATPTFTGTQTAATFGLRFQPSVSSFTNSSTFYGTYVDVSAVNTGTVYSGIFTGGNFGIGTTSPLARLSVKGAGTTTGINFQTTNSNDTPLFSILDNGNVGIGTTSPYAKLSLGPLSSGTYVGIGANSTTALTGAVTGINLDLSTNFSASNTTNQVVTGAVISLPALTSAGVGAGGALRGLVISGGTLDGTLNAPIYTWTGASITAPTGITGASASLEMRGILVNAGSSDNALSSHYGIDITSGNTTNDGALYGMNITTGTNGGSSGIQKGIVISAQGISAGTLIGLDLGRISSPGAGTETAISIGTGWERGIISQTTGTSTFAGTFGIGSSTPYAKLSVRGDGTTTGVNFQTTNSSNSPLFTILDNGNVGIGTTTPSTDGASETLSLYASGGRGKISIVGDAGDTSGTAQSELSFESVGNGAQLANGGQRLAYIRASSIGTTAGNRGGQLDFFTKIDGGTGSFNQAMTIDNTGNVGIGNNAPSTKLAITSLNASSTITALTSTAGYVFGAETQSITRMIFRPTGGQTVPVLSVEQASSAGTSGAIFEFFGTGRPGATNREALRFLVGNPFSITGTSDAVIDTEAAGTGVARNIRFNPGGSQNTLFIGTTGRVGVGTTSPVNQLAIASSSSNVGLSITSTLSSGTSRLLLGTDNDGIQGTSLYHFNSSFSPGVDAYAANRFTAVNWSNGGMSFATPNGGDVRFYTGGLASTNNRLTITAAGNVGVGTSSPTTKFWVQSTGASGDVMRFARDQAAVDAGAYISFNGGTNSATARGYVGFGRTGGGAATLFSAELDNSFGIRSEGALHLGSGGNNIRMTLASGGNVGINTLTPTLGQLTVAGPQTSPVIALQDNGAAGAAAAAYLGFYDNAGTRKGYVGDAGAADSNIFIASDAGNVTITGTGGSCTLTGAASGGTCFSDARLKNVSGSITNTLSGIAALDLVKYQWNELGREVTKASTHDDLTGFIAQDIEAVFPELVITDSKGYKQVDYGTLSMYGLQAIKELSFQTLELSLATTTLATRLSEMETAWTTAQEAEELPQALTATQVTAESLEITESIAANGTVSAARFVVPAEAQTFTLGTETVTVTVPSEALTAGKADLYALATYTLASVEQLRTRTELLTVKIEDLTARVTALETGTDLGEAIDGAAGLSASTLKNLLRTLGLTISNGVARVTALVTEQLVFTADENGTSSAGSVVIDSGETEVKVENAMVLPTSKIFITFTGSVQGSWYLTEKQAGSFKVKFSQPQPSTTGFDYFIVQTEGQIASAGAAQPEPSAGGAPAPEAPAPVSQDGGPTVSLTGEAAIQVPQGGAWTDPGATAAAANGTPLTVAVSGSVDVNTPGIYTVTYRATDSEGRIGEASRIVSVLAPSMDGGEEAPQVTGEPAPEPTAAALEPAPEAAAGPEPAPTPAT